MVFVSFVDSEQRGIISSMCNQFTSESPFVFILIFRVCQKLTAIKKIALDCIQRVADTTSYAKQLGQTIYAIHTYILILMLSGFAVSGVH